MSASPHITAVERQAKLKRLAAEKFRVAGGKVEKYAVDFSAQDAQAVVAAAKKRERMLNPVIGERDERGVFLGVWEPKDRDGNSLSQKFNVFAAPQDLPYTMTYIDAVKHIASLKDWNGFDGTDYANDGEILTALKDGSYNGGWIIPPRELLSGTAPEGNSGRGHDVAQPDNLFVHQNTGAFRRTFTTMPSRNDCPMWYWSSTNPSGQTHVWNVNFSDGYEILDENNKLRQSCRPVRLEPKL